MNRNKKVLCFALIVIFLSNTVSLLACTGFVAVKNGKILAGQNVDWKNPHHYCWFQPAEKGKYGCFFFGQLPGWMSGAANDQGLYVVGAATPPIKMKKFPGQKTIPTMRKVIKTTDHIYRTCANVDQYLDALRKYHTKVSIGHSVAVDKTGKSVLIEADSEGHVLLLYRGETKFRYLMEELNKTHTPPPVPETLKHKPYFQAVTNFLYTAPYRKGVFGCYPCWRYDIVVDRLNKAEDISVPLFEEILEAVHQEGEYPTKRSIVYDVLKGEITFSYLFNYDKKITFNIKEELKKGYRLYDFRELFGLRWHPRFILALLILLSPLLWPVLYLVRRFRGPKAGDEPVEKEKKRLPVVAASLGLINSLFLLVVLYEYPYILSHLLPFVKNHLYVRFYHEIFGKLFIGCLVLLPPMLYFAAISWTRRFWSLARRIHYSALLVTIIAIVALMSR